MLKSMRVSCLAISSSLKRRRILEGEMGILGSRTILSRSSGRGEGSVLDLEKFSMVLEMVEAIETKALVCFNSSKKCFSWRRKEWLLTKEES